MSKVVSILILILFLSSCSNPYFEEQDEIEYGGDGSEYFPFFSRSLLFSFKDIPSNYIIQSIAIYDKFWFGVGHEYRDDKGKLVNRCFIVIYNIESSKYITTLFVENLDLKCPHANVSCFGNEKLDDSIFPPLYVSQWDYDGERGIIVIKIINHNNNFTCEVIQTILPNIKNMEVFGYGATDWIVDTDRNKLYSLAYYKAGFSTIEKDNKECICVFNLPKINDGRSIVLLDEDIQDHFELEMINYSQDKCYYDGNIFVSSGHDSYPNWLKIRKIDLNKKCIISVMDISKWGGEPEGMDIYRKGILLNYYANPRQYLFEFQ